MVSVTADAHARANSVQSEAWRSADSASNSDFACSDSRQARMSALLGEHDQQLTPELLQAFCADQHIDESSKESGPICRPRAARGAPWTNAAFVANLTERCVDMCIGSPIDSEFLRFGLDF